jgi:hypothetical protein
MRAVEYFCYQAKVSNLELKTWSKQLLVSVLLDIMLPGFQVPPSREYPRYYLQMLGQAGKAGTNALAYFASS